MKHFHKNRLLKLADFLDTLPRKQFDLTLVLEERPCGTVGCAMGWTPTVFPRLVSVDRKQSYCDIRTDKAKGFGSVAKEIFGLTVSEITGLFCPDSAMVIGDRYLRYGQLDGPQNYKEFNDSLPDRAWPSSVAKRIRRFITRKERFEEALV